MAKITYKPQLGDPHEVEWNGKTFTAGKAVDFDGRTTEHKPFIESAKGNPWFDVDGESTPQKDVTDNPESAEEYRAYALDWIKKAKTSKELNKRWSAEESMRDDLGWGADDQALIDPIYLPKLENLENAER